jgi:TPR repeat protein
MKERISILSLLSLAVKSAREAAALEDALAAYQRGDYPEAEALLLVAGHAGHPNAQELLGFMYAIGPDLYPGVWRSLTASRNWFDRAARAGRPSAQYMQAAFVRRGPLEVRADIMACFNPTTAPAASGPLAAVRELGEAASSREE